MRQRSPTLVEIAKHLNKLANSGNHSEVEWKLQFNRELIQLIKEGEVIAERTGDADEFRFVATKKEN